MTANELEIDDWLKRRKTILGASEVAAILGEDPRFDALDVYERKVVGKIDEEGREWLEWGHLMEEPIARKYERKTGRKVKNLGPTTIQIHPDIPWLGATLDRQIGNNGEVPGPGEGPGALEIKNIEAPRMRVDEWRADSPEILHHCIQNQIQMACTGWSWGSIVGHFPYYQMPWFDLKRDDDLLFMIYPILEEFWCGHVLKGLPPAPQTLKSLGAIKRLWTKESGEVIDLTSEEQELANQLDQAKALKKGAEATIKELETKLRYSMKEATFGRLPDGTFLSLKTVYNKGYTTTVEPFEYRALKREKPKGGAE